MISSSHGTTCSQVTRYQEQPQLLDSLLQRLLDPLGSLLDGLIRQGDAVPHLSTLVGLSRWIWTLATVRYMRMLGAWRSDCPFAPSSQCACHPHTSPRVHQPTRTAGAGGLYRASCPTTRSAWSRWLPCWRRCRPG